MNEKLMKKGVELLLEGMGVDFRSEPDFVETPKRVAKLYAEMLKPEKSKWTVFKSSSSDLVLLRGHRVFALCPHHLLPVELRCYVAYIPNKLTVGLSKLARVVEWQLTKPITQEDLAFAVADELERRLEPKGSGVVLAGTHGCMRYRGVETDGDVIVSVMRGVLLLNPAARSEFLQLIGRP